MRKTLEDAIKTGDWSDEVLNKFENLIKEKRNEKINSERSMGEGRNFSSSKSEIHEGAPYSPEQWEEQSRKNEEIRKQNMILMQRKERNKNE